MFSQGTLCCSSHAQADTMQLSLPPPFPPPPRQDGSLEVLRVTYCSVQVTASSPVCRNTDPKAVVSRNFQRMNFAGASSVSGQAQTWWQVDLGQRHSLTCNYYTLRQDGSQDCVRNWIMQVAYSVTPLIGSSLIRLVLDWVLPDEATDDVVNHGSTQAVSCCQSAHQFHQCCSSSSSITMPDLV